MAVRTRKPIAEDDETGEETSAIEVRSKVKGGSKTRLVLMEDDGTADDDEVPHSGVVENGVHIYDKNPVRGGLMINQAGEVVNHKGHEIDPETGEVVDPDRYKEETPDGF